MNRPLARSAICWPSHKTCGLKPIALDVGSQYRWITAGPTGFVSAGFASAIGVTAPPGDARAAIAAAPSGSAILYRFTLTSASSN
jgi:hypothetical protein